MLNRSVLLPLVVGSCTLCWTLSQAQPVTPNKPETPEVANAPVKTEVPDPFAPAIQASKDGDLDKAEKVLRAIKAKGLEAGQFNRWEILASRTALRQGNIKWLKEINETSALGDNANELLLLGAQRDLLAANLRRARILLESVHDPEALAEIPRRRYYELWTRLEQLSGNPKAELVWAEKLVNFAAKWDSATCRSCHDNPKTHPGEVSTLDLKGWWTGERYSALLASTGAAQAEVNSTRTLLAKNPKDAPARMRLAFALRAMNKTAESDKEFRTFPWAKFPDRPEKKPLRFAIFP